MAVLEVNNIEKFWEHTSSERCKFFAGKGQCTGDYRVIGFW